MRRLLRTSAFLWLALSCGEPGTRSTPQPLDRPEGINVYDPRSATNGYTLAFRSRQHPILLDMRGHIVREWPDARLKSRVRLLEGCTLLGIGAGRAVVELDWQGREIWRARFEGRFPHHDVIRLRNGNTVVLTRAHDNDADDVLELDVAGEVVWQWSAAEPLAPWIVRSRQQSGDSTHINSVQELPENPWYTAGDERFRPGNLLMSARNLDLALIVDKRTGKVVWTYEGDLDLQHEALMIGPEGERNGNIVIFNNRFASFRGDRQSEVIEIDPRNGSLLWTYTAPGFYSPTSGSQQPLANGNVLISSSQGGRVFEVDRAGRTVWEWAPGYRLNRPSRYPADFCPELASLPPAERPAVRPTGKVHVDRDSYRFSRAGDRQTVEVDGVERQVLTERRHCAQILVPQNAIADLNYGTLAEVDSNFSIRLRNPETDQATTVFEDVISSSEWRSQRLDLSAVALERVEMCVEVSEPDEATRLAFWQPPQIGIADAHSDDSEAATDLTAEELAVRQEHLRAMGYVN